MGERELVLGTAQRAGRAGHFYRKFALAQIGALAALMGAVSAAQAIPIQLSQLLQLPPGQGIVQGDKLFTNFSFIVTGIGTYNADPNTILVEGTTSQSGEFGLIFTGAPTAPMIFAGTNSFVDVLLGFDVIVLDPNKWIHDLSLGFDASAPLDGHAQVVETALDLDAPAVIGQAQVDVPVPPNSTFKHIDLAPGIHKKVHIVKDIVAIGGARESATITTITQTFSQLPEPTTIGLLGIGSLFLLRRRRSVSMARLAGRALPTVLTALIIMSSVSSAWAVPLQTLADNSGNPNGTVTSGDKLMSNFSYEVITNVGRTIFDPAAMDVSAIQIGPDYGLRFGGLFGALSSVIPNSELVVELAFDVTVLDPALFIHDITLVSNPATTTLGGTAKVEETAYANQVAVANLISQPPPAQQLDHVNLPGIYKTLHIVKLVTVKGGENGVATISFIDQVFSQVPEPATLAALICALPMLRRRRSA